ncbi:MAG: multidrug effflux MFS transporter [Gammaproteobacteria bacterium]|nr:multidrug effflux MFS transporter [Gammaproteobacteria bacterium]
MSSSAGSGIRAPVLLLGLASALSPFGMVVVVPTLAEFGRLYQIDYVDVQFLISAYLFGLGVAQPFAGWLCDRLGRRPVMLGGFAVFVLASLACALVREFDTLILMRLLQAAGVSVGTIASRAIVRDTHDEAGTAQTMAVIAAAMGIAPVLGPVAGGLISDAFGPQAVFIASATLGVLVWLRILARLPETRPAGLVGAGGWSHFLRDYRALLGSRVFMGYTLMFGTVQGGFFVFLAVGAAVFENDLGVDQRGFGLIWGLLAIAYVIGAAIASRLTPRVGHHRMLQYGLILTASSSLGILALELAAGISLASLTVLLALLTSASGLVIPGSMAGAVSYRPDIAGTSSGLSSALGLVLSGAFTILSGSLYDGRFLVVASLIALAGVLTALTGLMVRRQGDRTTA